MNVNQVKLAFMKHFLKLNYLQISLEENIIIKKKIKLCF